MNFRRIVNRFGPVVVVGSSASGAATLQTGRGRLRIHLRIYRKSIALVWNSLGVLPTEAKKASTRRLMGHNNFRCINGSGA